MRIYSIQTLIRAVGLTLAVLLWTGGSARAQNWYNWSDLTSGVSSGPNDNQVALTFTKASGSGTTTLGATATGFEVQQQVGQFNSTSVGSPFGAFCIDLWHGQSANPYSGTPYALNSTNGTFNGSTSILSLFAAAPNSASVTANELTYLGTVYQAIKSAGDSSSIAALSLAIWNVIDKNFAVSGAGSNVTADLTLIKDLLAGTGETIDGHAITAYNSGDTYSGATILQTNTGPGCTSSDQNLITWGTITTTVNTQSVAPEPSTLAIAGLGALAFMGYGLRRRKALVA